jgi:hypothetical protein
MFSLIQEVSEVVTSAGTSSSRTGSKKGSVNLAGSKDCSTNSGISEIGPISNLPVSTSVRMSGSLKDFTF